MQLSMQLLRRSDLSSSVFIVDDSNYVSVPLEIALRCLDGFRVIRVFNATDAWEILSDPCMQITAMITDLNMPVITGYELIASVRADERYRALPVIAFSGDDGAKVAERAMRSGADAFFEKPFSMKDLRSTLQLLLNKWRSSA